MLLYLLEGILAVSAIAIILMISLQESKEAGLGSAITGITNSYLYKNKKTMKEYRRVRITWILIAMILLIGIVAHLGFIVQ